MQFKVFIVCHDQVQVINKPHNDDYCYLFVGWGVCDIISSRKDVIICRELVHNIEDRIDLLSFTAWYAIAKNNLCDKSYCCILEYDTIIKQDLSELEGSISPNVIIGFVSHPISSYSFLDVVHTFEKHVKQKLQLENVRNLYVNQEEFICTSNALLHINLLKEFVDNYVAIIQDFQSDRIAHCHERYISIFCKIHQIEHLLVPDYIDHLQANSHSESLMDEDDEHDYPEQVFPYQYLPFNGDVFAQKAILNLKQKFNLTSAIETGSFLFSTSIWLSKHFDLVFTSEQNYKYYKYGTKRIKKKGIKNICAHLGNSVDLIRKTSFSDNTFFFLDAHSKNVTPLLQELELIANQKIKPVIAIHDFFNPHKPEYGYDTYNEQPYTLEWIRPHLEKIYDKCFTVTYNDNASGAKRGILYVCPTQ